MTAPRPLVRHFLGSLIGRGVLQDDGVEAVRGVLFTVVAGLVTVGVMLPRQFYRIYLELSYLPDPEPFRRAMLADSVFMLSLPFCVALVAAALVAPSMFPDEVDYLTLVPLPVTRRRIFGAKLLALALFVGALLAALSTFSAMAFPMFTHQRWAEGHILVRIGAHAVAAAGSASFGFVCVVAVQGLGSVWAPRRWVSRLAVIVPCAIITGVILAVPLVLQLPTHRIWVSSQPELLAWFPPAWFAGLERVLLGVADDYWTSLARIGMIVTLVVMLVSGMAYAALYRSFERVVLGAPRTSASGHPERSAEVPVDAWAFTRMTLFRNRLPLLLFLIFVAVGLGLVTRQALGGLLDELFRWDEPPPSQLLLAAITMPLVLMLTGLTGLRMAFLLPVQSRANWIFRVTDSPVARARHLAGVERVCLRLVVIPVLLFAVPVQIWVIGTDAWKTLGLSVLAGLVMCEVVLAGWRRVPFTCTWIPGKRPLVLTIVIAGLIYAAVAWVLASVMMFALFSWPLLSTLSGILLTTAVALRQWRTTTWTDRPLLFEDEPHQVQTLGLR